MDGSQLSERIGRRFFKSLDHDGSGSLSLDEFLEVCNPPLPPPPPPPNTPKHRHTHTHVGVGVWV
jgi:hypothetical protein